MIARGLAAWYRLDGNLTDSSGNGNNAQLVSGSANYISGQYGQAYSFPATANRLSAGTTTLSAFDSGQPFTVSFWMHATNHAKFGAIICSQESGATGRGIQVGLSRNTSPNSILLRLQGAQRLQREGTVQVDTGAWVFIAVTYDGSKQASGLKIFVNGVEDGAGAVVDNDPVGMTTTQPVYFGARNANEIPYEGGLDNVMPYNRALSLSEIKTLYALGSPL